MNPVFKVKAVTCRKNPIMQVCIGASEEHVNMAGIPSEASILAFLHNAMPGNVKRLLPLVAAESLTPSFSLKRTISRMRASSGRRGLGCWLYCLR